MLQPTPPVAAGRPKLLVSPFGTRTDDYYWLQERDNLEVLAYLEAENAYFEAQMAPVQDLQAALVREIRGRMQEQDESVPYLDNGYYYYVRYETGAEYPIYCRKLGSLEAPEQVLLDANALAVGHDYYHLGGLEVSNDNQVLAYADDTVSRRLYTLRFRNLTTGQEYPEAIANTSGNAVWATDNQTVFYTKKDENTLLDYQVYRHMLGSDPATDVLVYEETDNTFYTAVTRSKSREYILIQLTSTMAAETWFLPAAAPTQPLQLVQAREDDHLYEVEHFGPDFYILSNDGAPNFRLLKTPVTAPGKENWQEVIGHRDDVFLENMELLRDYLVLGERHEGLLKLRVRPWHNPTQEHYLPFGEPTYTAAIGINPEFDTTVLRYVYSSLTTPTSTFDYDLATRHSTLRKEQPVLGGFRKQDYATERLYAPAADGTRIPLSVVYKKGFKLDGSAPLLQYAYGSYGLSMDATFSAARLSLLDRGFVYVICHIRGGQELGRQWYENGKKLRKKNTFTDFTDCSKYLITQQYTAADRLFAMGGSAGGLLMGAIINLHPELYRGVVAAVPFVDVVTTMLDDTIPLTTGEYDEWGNPNQQEFYDYMLSYSPYDNVQAQAYPNMLVTTGLHDSQVQYFEPAKWVAKLRALKTDSNLLLLHTDLAAGHGGASGRFKSIHDVARQFAFMLLLLGVRE
ncbi:oligopeptidase B [Hymenobacter amundsenii]|uniref:Proline-specific endopeptidase n=1 Tax=Hymenobacter amundsenii TaxID=2006685 RepID=A0A246FIQ3_9BACT|nr:S9 family peptidase [Hymenobacter amundsenii]OWP62410.1 oligopeptidase B [Hymenobacter amundsenii]